MRLSFRHRQTRSITTLAFQLLLCSVPLPAAQASIGTSTTPTEAITLRQAIERAIATHPAMRAAGLDIELSELAVREVLNKKKPAIELGLKTGLVPEAKGDIFESPDTNEDLDNLGIFWRTDLRIVQPITTFGKISSARAAAESSVLFQAFGRDFEATKIGFEVVRAFWGLEAAVRGADLAIDLQDDYENLLEEVEKAVEDPDSDVDDTRLFEVQSFEFQIVDSKQKVLKQREVAVAELETLLGWEGLHDQSFEPVSTPTLPDDDLLDRLISQAIMDSPPIQQAQAGLKVLDSKIELARASRWPDIFLALSGAYARAPNRTDIKSPFILDPFNLRTIGGFLGVRWNLKYSDHRLEITQAEVERAQAQEEVAVLENRLVMEVTRAYANAKAVSATLSAARRSEKAAKSWLRLSGDNWDLGLGSVDRLVNAYGQYYDLAVIVIEQEVKYHLALARLAATLGQIGHYLDWIEHEKVEIG